MSSDKTKKERLIKVVLRRLPLGMSEEELLKQLNPVSDAIQQHWFLKADLELLPFAFSRAYFVFNLESEAIAFCDRFNGYVFVDKLGNESIAIAEQAPCQLLPNRESKDKDRRLNTIESDQEYLKFLKKYNNLTFKKVTNFDALLKELEEKRKLVSYVRPTPLTEFLRTKQLLNKDKKRVSRNEKFGISRLDRTEGGRSERLKRNEIGLKTENLNGKSLQREKKRPPRSDRGVTRAERATGRFNDKFDNISDSNVQPKLKVLTYKNKIPSVQRQNSNEEKEGVREKKERDAPRRNRDRKRHRALRGAEKISNEKNLERSENSSSVTANMDAAPKILRSNPTIAVRLPTINDAKEEIKKEKPKTRDLRDAPRRNKFRPERAIYQPGSRQLKLGNNQTQENDGS